MSVFVLISSTEFPLTTVSVHSTWEWKLSEREKSLARGKREKCSSLFALGNLS